MIPRLLMKRIAIAAVAALALTAASCSKDAATERPKGDDGRPVPISAAKAVTRDVPIEMATFGSVEPFASVSVRAQVTGPLDKVHFRKGQNVKKGDLLFTIDPRPFQAALDQATANLAHDTVQAENARKEADRTEELLLKKIASVTDRDKARADADSLAATVRADQAAVENAKLQLEHCTIRCPIDGRTGDLLVDQGNLVKSADVPLVIINQVHPIDVQFSIPQSDLAAVKKHLAAGKLTVQVTIPREEDRPETGDVTFVDNAIDKTTGTIRLRATLENANERLWPGRYVNIRLTLTTLMDAVVVPSRAVQTGREGKYVYVVKADKTVEVRHVTVRTAADNDVVIDSGLTAGETVVTDGHVKLRPGAKVQIAAAGTRPASGPADEPATRPRGGGRGAPATQARVEAQP